MMAVFGKASRKRLATAHPDLQRIFNEVIKIRDCKVMCGYRGRADQEKALESGASFRPWPTSKHNSVPSLAVDVVPWPESYGSDAALKELGAVVKETAARLGIRIRWGGDYRARGSLGPGWDKPHYELV